MEISDLVPSSSASVEGVCISPIKTSRTKTLRRIQNLNGFSIQFFCLHSTNKVTLRHIQNLEWIFYPIFLLTLHAQSNAPTYTKFKWLFYWIFCSHSALNVTLQRILRLPTSVGLAQARPNNLHMPRPSSSELHQVSTSYVRTSYVRK